MRYLKCMGVGLISVLMTQLLLHKVQKNPHKNTNTPSYISTHSVERAELQVGVRRYLSFKLQRYCLVYSSVIVIVYCITPLYSHFSTLYLCVSVVRMGLQFV